MHEAKKRTAVLISGRGSNLAALVAASRDKNYPAEIALVISNRRDAAGLDLAANAGIATSIIDHAGVGSKLEFEAAIDSALRRARIELVCLAGFMRVLSPTFVSAWRDRILNIHPSLLPLFPGLDTHERALAAGVKEHGATVHFVRAATDQGPILAQAAVPVLAGDTPQTLAARVLAAEHRIYPLALRLVASGRAKVVGEQVVFADERDRQAALGASAGR